MSDLKLQRKRLQSQLAFWSKIKSKSSKFESLATELGDIAGKSATTRATALGKALEAKNETKIEKEKNSLSNIITKKLASIDKKIEKEKIAKEKAVAKERAAREKAVAKEKAAKEKAAAKERAAKEKEKAAKEKEKAARGKAPAKGKTGKKANPKKSPANKSLSSSKAKKIFRLSYRDVPYDNADKTFGWTQDVYDEFAEKHGWNGEDYTVFTTRYTNRLLYDNMNERLEELDPVVVFSELDPDEEFAPYIKDRKAYDMTSPIVKNKDSVVFKSSRGSNENLYDDITMLHDAEYCGGLWHNSILSITGYEVGKYRILHVIMDTESG